MFDTPDKDRLAKVEKGMDQVVAALVPEDWDNDPKTPPNSWLAEELKGLGGAIADLTAAVKAGGGPVAGPAVLSDADRKALAADVADLIAQRMAQ